MSSLVSYAQNFEDVMLWRTLHHVENGLYLDLGAQNPDFDSVSRLFYDHGWRGVHVEPVAAYAQRLRERRPDERVLEVAVGTHAGEMRFFEIADSGLSTLDPGIADDHRSRGFAVREIEVSCLTLDAILEQMDGRDVHWMKIDVEGAEADVIRSWSVSTVRPWVLVIESTAPLSTEPSYQSWEPDVLGKGYQFAYFDGLNRFYVSQEHLDLMDALQCAPNVFDGFVLAPDSSFCAITPEAAAATAAAELLAGNLRGELDALTLERDAGQQEFTRLLAQKDSALLAEVQVREELERTCTQLRAELEALTQDRDSKQHELISRQAQLDAALHEAHMRSQAERACRKQISALNEALDASARSVDACRGELEHARTAHSQTLRVLNMEHTYMVEMLEAECTEFRTSFANATALAESHRLGAHHWLHETEKYRLALGALESSRSWRLTAPLRAVNRLLVQWRQSPRGVVRSGVLRGMRQVLRRPTAGPLLNRMVKTIPPLHRRLRALAQHQGLIAVEEAGVPSPAHALGQVGIYDGVDRAQIQHLLSTRGQAILLQMAARAKERAE